MKYIFILLICLLVSCEEPTTYQNAVYKQQVEQVEYIEKYCPHCNGMGKVKMSTGDRVILGILTFGPGALCDTEVCEYAFKRYSEKIRNL